MPVAVVIGSTPLRPRKKSKCHQERRNSPSVASFNPTSSCFLTIFSISRSSTALSAAASISFRARLARASLSGAVRSKLPTWSARNGGVFRCVIARLLPPYFFRQLHDHPQLGPLFFLGEHIALLGRSKPALRRQAELVERHISGGLFDTLFHFGARLETPGLRRHQTEHDHLLAFRQETQWLKATGAVGVVFEKISIVVAFSEQVLSHRFVAAR